MILYYDYTIHYTVLYFDITVLPTQIPLRLHEIKLTYNIQKTQGNLVGQNPSHQWDE